MPAARSDGWTAVLSAILVLSLSPASAAAAAAGDVKPLCSAGSPHLEFHTSEGDLSLELWPRAAPRAVARLARLAEGPIYNPALFDEGESARSVGYFDGLAIDFTHPNIEIAVEVRAPKRLFEFPAEIDAEALGLHEKRIASAGEAMDLLQRELLVQFRERGKDPDRVTPKLRQWLTRFYENSDPSFLVGVSWKEINEALGYRYERGLESRPASAGAVLLAAPAPGRASLRLSLVLVDMPQRTGREMVIGRLVRGLDLARAISLRPLLVPPELRDRRYRPAHPVVIERARVVCN